MEAIVHILGWLPAVARSDDTDYGKLIFFAIGLIIWIISAIAKSAGGKGKSQQTWTGEDWTPEHQQGEWTGEGWSPQQQPPPQQPAPPPQSQPMQWPSQWTGQPRPQQPQQPPAYQPPPYVPPAPPAVASAPAVAARQAMISDEVSARERQAYALKDSGGGRPPPIRRSPAARSRTKPLDAAALRRWMTPQVMRQQYILTELFDPPASDRPSSRN